MKEIKASNAQSVGTSKSDMITLPFQLHWAGTGVPGSVDRFTTGNVEVKRDTAIFYHQDLFKDGFLDIEILQIAANSKVGKTTKYILFDAEFLIGLKDRQASKDLILAALENIRAVCPAQLIGITGDDIGFNYFDDSISPLPWMNFHDEFEEVYAAFSFICPQWYFTQVGGKDVPTDRQGRWLDGQTLEFMRFSRTPIYPLAWLRYHEVNKTAGLTHLNFEDSKKIVNTAKRFKIDKIFLWDHFTDDYMGSKIKVSDILTGYETYFKTTLPAAAKGLI